ncbi:flavin reductase [Exophiala viscosa]|uniref:Flavin reductase n=1 Tax=Exophiala viscosa TaxID=2486360 RepID=A0AAN6E2T3_9EURO|nr:flavin reductase [Exophiala viscosa]KAI1629581.1 flavin reductase [Exophiala viscosa]
MLPQIFVIGATGRTGQLVVDEALKRGHPVTALVRKPTSTLPQHDNLTITTGDPCRALDVETALRSLKPSNPVVIISTLGQTRTSGNPWAAATSPPRFMDASARAVLAACQAVRDSVTVQKIVLMSLFGAGDSFAQLNFLMRFIMRHSNMAQTLEDQNLVDQTIRKNGNVPFVLVRPAMLTNGEVAPVKVHGTQGKGAGFMPSVSASSVARFMLDATATKDFDNKAVVVSN